MHSSIRHTSLHLMENKQRQNEYLTPIRPLLFILHRGPINDEPQIVTTYTGIAMTLWRCRDASHKTV